MRVEPHVDWIKHAFSYEFQVGGHDRFYVERRTDETWAVVLDGFCLDTSVDGFVYEPSPSNRDEDFLKTTRFQSKEAAYEALQGWLARWERGPRGDWRKKCQP